MKRQLVSAGILAVILLVLATQWDAWQRDPLRVRPAAQALVLLLTIALLFQGRRLLRAAGRPRVWTLRASMRSVGWLIPLAHVVVVAGVFISSHLPRQEGGPPTLTTLAVVSLVTPLVIGFHAALLFSPDEEPFLELLITYPRALMWLIAERLAIVLLVHSAIGLTGQLVAAQIFGETSALFGMREWLPAALLFAAIGFNITLFTRQIVFGVGAVCLIWAAAGLFGSALLGTAPVLWVVHPYLDPALFASDDYLLNRLLVLIIGSLVLVISLSRLVNEEVTFTGHETREVF